MTELSQSAFDALIQGDVPVLVDFWAAWCMPCRVLAPVVEEIADELDGRVETAKLNIDDYPDVAARYGIASIPTLVLFQNGQPSDQLVGVVPKAQILQMVESHL